LSVEGGGIVGSAPGLANGTRIAPAGGVQVNVSGGGVASSFQSESWTVWR
jgi:hypothetical protein